MHKRMRYPTVALVLVVGVVLVACGLSPQRTPTPVTGPTVLPPASPSPTLEPVQPTPTSVPPTSTPVPPTPTSVPPTSTSVPPTSTPVPPTPTSVPPTSTPVPPTPTQAQQPPQAAILKPPDGFHSVMPKHVHVEVSASSGAGLDRVELWGYHKGQHPQLYNTWTAGGQQSFTDKVGWPPPRTGTFYLFAYAYDGLGQRGQSAQITVYVEQPEQPTATTTPTSVVGRWGAQIDSNTSFVLMVSSQDGRKLHGTFTLMPEDETGDLHNSKIDGDSVTIRADIVIPGGSPVTYNFMLTLSGDGQSMSGQWSRSDMGIPQPVTFSRLVE
jgi:hypothetical protein